MKNILFTGLFILIFFIDNKLQIATNISGENEFQTKYGDDNRNMQKVNKYTSASLNLKLDICPLSNAMISDFFIVPISKSNLKLIYQINNILNIIYRYNRTYWKT